MIKKTLLFLGCLACVGSIALATPVGTAFTYQGRLDDGGRPANGTYQMVFALHAVLEGGSPLATNGLSSVLVSNGLFTAEVDLGAAAWTSGHARWVEVSVRTNGPGAFVPLAPRTCVTPAPVAQHSATAGMALSVTDGAVSSTALSTAGTAPLTGQVLIFDGRAMRWQYPAPASVAWAMGGNDAANGDFVGTRNNLPLILKANGGTVLRAEPTATTPNLIGGFAGNYVSNGVVGAFIGGGGAANLYGVPGTNRVLDGYGTLCGGASNTVGSINGDPNDALYDFLGGGFGNISEGYCATVGGGAYNRASGGGGPTVAGGWANTGSGWASSIGGGANNVASGTDTTISGGYLNTAAGLRSTIGGGHSNRSAQEADTVGGGYYNVAQGSSCVVGGGYQNSAGAPGAGAVTVAGGTHNTASGAAAAITGGGYNQASGPYSAIVGGENNLAARLYDFVGGGHNNRCTSEFNNGEQAAHNVIAGGKQNTVTDGHYSVIGGGYQNVVRDWYATVAGGVLNEASASGSFAAGTRAKAVHIGSFVWGDTSIGDFASKRANSFNVRCAGGAFFETNPSGYGAMLGPNDTTWRAYSDRNLKKNFKPVDRQALLRELAKIPVSKWNYRWEEDHATPHLGPMAQDFKAAFFPGRDDKTISTLEFDGVELAAIQGLNELVAEKDARISALDEKVATLEKQLATQSQILTRWETRFTVLEQTVAQARALKREPTITSRHDAIETE